MDDMKIIHVGAGDNLPTYDEIKKINIKNNAQVEHSMMLEYLQSLPVVSYSDKLPITINNVINDSSIIEILSLGNYNIDYNESLEVVENLSRFNSDTTISLEVLNSVNMLSNLHLDINTLLESLNNHINVVSPEEVPDKPKLINKGKSYHDKKKNLRFLNKRK